MTSIQLDHIAIAIPRLADAPAVLVGELGGAPAFDASARAFTFGQWRFAGGGRIEIIAPRGGDGFLHRFLAQRGPGIHHVTFTVPSLRQACDRAEAHGYEIVGYDDSDPTWSEAFLHPRQAQGFVVQLAESRSSDGEPHDWDAPPGPPSPVTIVGLRLRARSRDRALMQWAQVLEGQRSEDDGVLVFRWPGSPMRLAVEIDPDGEEGARCIELTSDRDVPLPPGPHPVLGAVFARRPAAPSVLRSCE